MVCVQPVTPLHTDIASNTSTVDKGKAASLKWRCFVAMCTFNRYQNIGKPHLTAKHSPGMSFLLYFFVKDMNQLF